MKYIFNSAKAQKAVKDFYTSTGVAVVIYDSEKTPVAASKEYCSYCKYVRQGKNCDLECRKSDVTHINEAARIKGVVKYRCHAGLMEVITPVIHSGIVIAYLQLGQFREKSEIQSETLKEVTQKYNLNEATLKELYNEVSFVSDKKLEALLYISDIIMKYFWQEGIIYNNRSVLALKVEDYIEKRICETVYIEDIEREFFNSKSAMYNFFKAEFNSTPNDYIIGKRLEMAEKLLKEDKNKNVTEVAAICGFNDYNYFIRLFKSKVGKTPLKYKKENTQN